MWFPTCVGEVESLLEDYMSCFGTLPIEPLITFMEGGSHVNKRSDMDSFTWTKCVGRVYVYFNVKNTNFFREKCRAKEEGASTNKSRDLVYF